MTLRDDFAAEVEAFLKEGLVGPTALGRGALGDPSFVPDLRAGRNPSLSVVERVRSFIEQKRKECQAA